MENIPNKIRYCVQIVSNKTHYQYFLILFLCFIWTQITYSAMIGSYVFMNPLFQCSGIPVTQVEACQDINLCKITNDFTAAYFNGLYCDKKQTRSAIQSIYAFGALIGMFGLPALADAKGRRFSLIFSFGIQIIGISLLILGINKDITILSLIGQFFTGIFASGVLILTYIITGQFCKDSIRQTAIMIYCSIWGLGEISFYFLFNYMPQWQNYLIYLLLVPSIILTILSVFFIYQTPDYCLIMAKDVKKFNICVQKLAAFNKASDQEIEHCKKVGEQLMQQSKIYSSSNKQATFQETMVKIYQTKFALRTCLCLALSQLAYNTFYYGVQGSLQRTGFNFGFSMLLIGLHEFIAYLTASYFIAKIKRKKGLIISIVITSLIGLAFVLKIVEQNNIIQSIIISVTRIGCVYAYSLTSILQTQSFSGQIKSTALGLTIALSQVGRILLPYLITAMNDIGVYPVIASSALFLILGIVPLFFVKETWKKQQERFEKSSTLIEDQSTLES